MSDRVIPDGTPVSFENAKDERGFRLCRTAAARGLLMSHITEADHERIAAVDKRYACLRGRKPTGVCERCTKREATDWWSGASSILDINRGAPIFAWCALCCVEALIEHSEKQAAEIAERLPKLRAERDALLASERAAKESREI